MSVKHFKYVKANGDTSERYVFVVSEPTENMLAIDLSEFNPEDQDMYVEALQKLQNLFLTGIEEIGLKNNWRSFKKTGIKPLKEA